MERMGSFRRLCLCASALPPQRAHTVGAGIDGYARSFQDQVYQGLPMPRFICIMAKIDAAFSFLSLLELRPGKQ